MILSIEQSHNLPVLDLGPLLQESDRSGFRSVQRLVDDWASGKNRFDQPGEAFFVATQDDRIIGLCGLNRDPYINDPSIGRIRRLYVKQAERRQGVGRALVQRVIAEACPTFKWLHVRTDNPLADRFYQSLRFLPCADDKQVTHKLKLGNDRVYTLCACHPR
ncbi:GNAT family N-acetyltransferase [Thermocoleostomius sinensis]|uniref:GNAT family N-acetyltransferase n=1 Tax=Thermocoleostomius sinensis A174 TaxID=2016057 RepID=A0A9E8Z8W3_9CYAN|nr:GNAT family N-acetyltransferase [Thermocoleostomius sinensis]WAL58660.1 GNAT family N-acetyltransferase [Thermocoleostomius sinensis A174]